MTSLTAINGRLLEGINAGLHPRDRGMMLGDGVFETLLAFHRVALWREAHLARMAASALALGLMHPAELITDSISVLLKKAAMGPQVLRLTLSRGVSLRGLASDSHQPTLVATCDPFDFAMAGKPVALVTSSIRRHGASFSDRHKTLSYINNVAAAREAQAKGCEDALMLNADGHVASTTIANIFIVKDGKLATPPLEDGVLNGVMRQFLIREFGAEQRSITVEDLRGADGCFVTNSLRLLRPVSALDGQALPEADCSAYLRAMLNEAAQQCGSPLPEIAP
jgi:branched-chain amino acid aminotransferase